MKPARFEKLRISIAHFLGALDLVDRVGQGGVLDEGVVGRVEDQHGVVFPRPGDPGFEVLARGDGPGRVVR